MNLIIDIPEEQFTTLNAKTQDDIVGVIDHAVLIKAIKNGTPLSKGHGTREEALDDVLKILDRYYLWHYEKSIGEYVAVDKEIEDKIRALKKGEQE